VSDAIQAGGFTAGDMAAAANDGWARGAQHERERIRQLHRPVWHDERGQSWLLCDGCDEGSHAELPAGWPCRTAGIVYSADEIAATEPQVPECAEDHGTNYRGTSVHPPAVFVRAADGQLWARRWKCDHVQPVAAADLLRGAESDGEPGA
jgi:hypothetical protein